MTSLFMSQNQKLIICLFLILYGLSLALTVNAGWVSDILGSELIPGDNPCQPKSKDCRCTGDCELKDFVIVAVKLFRLMLGVLGSLALLFFIYGGIIFLLSRGNPTMVQRGKSILTQSLVGIMIVLGSWFIVALVIAALTGQELGTSIKLFGQDWWQLKQ